MREGGRERAVCFCPPCAGHLLQLASCRLLCFWQQVAGYTQPHSPTNSLILTLPHSIHFTLPHSFHRQGPNPPSVAPPSTSPTNGWTRSQATQPQPHPLAAKQAHPLPTLLALPTSSRHHHTHSGQGQALLLPQTCLELHNPLTPLAAWLAHPLPLAQGHNALHNSPLTHSYNNHNNNPHTRSANHNNLHNPLTPSANSNLAVASWEHHLNSPSVQRPLQPPPLELRQPHLHSAKRNRHHSVKHNLLHSVLSSLPPPSSVSLSTPHLPPPLLLGQHLR